MHCLESHQKYLTIVARNKDQEGEGLANTIMMTPCDLEEDSSEQGTSGTNYSEVSIWHLVVTN